MRAAADNLTPVVLELGGKDAAILCEDVKLDDVVPLIMRGTFQNCGQNCIGLERVIAHTDIYDALVDRLTQLVANVRAGPPLEGGHTYDCGAMTMAQQVSGSQDL